MQRWTDGQHWCARRASRRSEPEREPDEQTSTAVIDEPLSEEERRAVARWRYIGQSRPKFAWIPAPGQESVWDYPRPPRLEPDAREVLVKAGEQLICRTRQAMRVLETASPPTFYLPPDTVQTALLVRAPGSSRCEWKGEAVYWSLARNGADSAPVAWSYPRPT